MNPIDLTILICYLGGILIFALVISRGSNLEGFLVNDRRTKSVFIVFSIVSTNVGAGTYAGIASAGYQSGISYAFMGVLVAIVGFGIVAWLAPRVKRFGDRWQAHTLGDFYLVRYGSASKSFVAVINLVVFIFFLASQFLAMSALLKVWTGLGMGWTLAFATGCLILYTAIAGVKSDIYTDFIHFLVMVVTIFGIMFPFIWNRAGGYESIRSNLPDSYFDIAAFGGWGFLIGAVIFGAPVLFVSMDIWQRLYATTSPKAARYTLLIAGALNIPLLAIPALIGIAAKASNMVLDNPDFVLFEVMKSSLPTGALGLALAGALAAFLSTANTMIMVITATILKDFIFPVWKGKISDVKLLRVGQIISIVVSLSGLLFAVLMPSIVRLSLNSFFTLMVLIPSVLGGFFWKRATSKAAAVSVGAGAIVTWGLLPFLPQMAFMPGFLVSLLSFIIVSFLTSHTRSERVLLN